MKILPHDLEAERAILGCILLDEHAAATALGCVNEADFYHASHRKIFAAIARLAIESKAVDPFTLKDELARTEDLEKIGGLAYLSSLTDGIPRATNIEHYASIIKEHAIKRSLAQISYEIGQKSIDAGFASSEIIDEAERQLLEIEIARTDQDFEPISALVSSTYRDIEERGKTGTGISGIDTGFSWLNEMTGGFRPGNLDIIAARPACGKTSLCLQIAAHAAIRKRLSVGIISLEMTATEILRRVFCSEAHVDSSRIERGFLNAENWRALSEAASIIGESRIWINDAGAISCSQLRAKSQKLKVRHGLDLLVIDYLQMVSGTIQRKQENRVQEISEITRALKHLAKDLNIPVVAASQLNRGLENRHGDHRPRLSDLRESGTIEQDADVVLFIHRSELYGATDDNAGKAEFILAKQRNGPTGSCEMAFMRQFTKFGELAKDEAA